MLLLDTPTKEVQYPMDRKLEEFQSRCGRCGEENISGFCREQNLGLAARLCTD
jgi:hypothetical protein